MGPTTDKQSGENKTKPKMKILKFYFQAVGEGRGRGEGRYRNIFFKDTELEVPCRWYINYLKLPPSMEIANYLTLSINSK